MSKNELYQIYTLALRIAAPLPIGTGGSPERT